MRINKSIIIRQIADCLIIFVSTFLIYPLIDQDDFFLQIALKSLSLALLLMLVCIPIYLFSGIYSVVRNYPINQKIIKIIQAHSIAGLTIIIIFMVFNYYLELNFTITNFLISDLSLAWILSLIGIIFSRLWIYFYLNVDLGKTISKNPKKVLVIGGAGYIGSSLLGQLLEKDYQVRLLDIFLFGEEPIKKYLNHKNLEIIHGDFRKIDDLVLAMKGVSSVVHLGGLVGDPACSVDEDLTIEINLTSTKIIAQIAKAEKVEKFIFASSCSVYGAQDEILDETSQTKPLSLYAKTKIASEEVLKRISDKDFSPIFLRFGTVYGFSGRTRFDLVVNLLTAHAYDKKSMTVFGKDQVRPFVHVEDAALSVVRALESQLPKNQNHVFNIGSNQQNCSLLELAELIKTKIPEAEIITDTPEGDPRNYNVLFDKAYTMLKLDVKWSLEDGINQVIEKFELGEITDYSQAKYSNVSHLHESGLESLKGLEFSDWEQAFLEEDY